MLNIDNLHTSVGGVEILRGFSLQAKPGSIHALMGQNGSGKSTFAHALAGHPSYTVTSGTAALNDTSLLELEPEERAAAGLFLAFQYPAAIPGVSVARFLHLALNGQEKAQEKALTGFSSFIAQLKAAMKQLHLPWAFADRSVNDGFSGGEKKRLEMLQMLVLKPQAVILDEIDSGLDIDAMKVVADAVHLLKKELPATIFLIITHYQRLLSHIEPDVVHIVQEGKIIRSGGPELAHELEKSGYKGLAPHG